MLQRPQWPHTVDDIVKSLDGVWGLVGATTETGTLLRLERSLHEPVTYTLVEYEGSDESRIAKKTAFSEEQKASAVNEFAKLLGFTVKMRA